MFLKEILYNVKVVNDKEFLTDAILSSEIEYKLREAAHSKKKITECIEDVSFENTNDTLLRNGHLQVEIDTALDVNEPFQGTLTPFYIQSLVEPRVIRFNDRGGQIVNSYYHAAFFMLRVSHGEINTFQSWSLEDKRRAKHFGKKFNLYGVWNSKKHLKGEHWTCTDNYDVMPIQEPNSLVLKHYDEHGNTIGFFQVFYFQEKQAYGVLPVNLFKHRKYIHHLRLFLPPSAPYSFFNLPFLDLFPDAVVVITNDPLLAFANPPNRDRIFLLNMGDDAWTKKMDYTPLKGRKIIYSIIDRNDDEILKQEYSKALKMAEKLQAADIVPKFVMLNQSKHSLTKIVSIPEFQFSPIPMNSFDGKVISLCEFIQQAGKLNVYVPESIRLDRYGEISFDNVEERKAIVENLIHSGSCSIIITQPSVEENLFSALIAGILAGKTHSPENPWLNISSRQHPFMVYIDIECYKQFLETFQSITNSELSDFKRSFLYDSRCFASSESEGIRLFKHAVDELNPKVIIFDADSIWQGGIGRIKIFREALRHCQYKDIATVIIIPDPKYLKNLPSVDRLVYVWHEKDENVVEIVSNTMRSLCNPFSLKFKDGSLIFSQVSEEKLHKLNSRDIMNQEPGTPEEEEENPFSGLSLSDLDYFE